MAKKIDTNKIQECIREIIIALGDDPNREGLLDTPKRVAKMYEEVFEGMNYSNKEIADMFGTTFEEEDYVGETYKNMVVVGNIPIHSYCEHHLALMYNMKISVAYIPDGRVIGLSKIARIVDMVCKRLQLQERIGTDIAEILEMILHTHDIMVVIEGEHSCMTARGIKKPGTVTKSAVLRGMFRENGNLRNEVYELLRS